MILRVRRLSRIIFLCRLFLLCPQDVFGPGLHETLGCQKGISSGNAGFPESVPCEPLPESTTKKQEENDCNKSKQPRQGRSIVRFHESILVSGEKTGIGLILCDAITKS